MASTSNSSFSISLLIFSSAALLPLFASGTTTGFSVELLHRDSPESPLQQPNSTPHSLLRAAAHRSSARAAYFRYAIGKALSNYDPTPFFSQIFSNNFEYLMSFYLGTPARKVIAIADTGSDLIWVQCKPCDKCFPQKTPLFDPEASTTYKGVNCNATSCSALPQASCGYESKCQYHYSYGDGSFANGSLSTDTIGFNATGGRQVNFPTTLFGCTHQSNGTFDKEDAGLVGLGGGRLSLVRQLGPAVGGKFSYCLPSWAQTAATARLNFGTAAVVNGAGAVTTPLIRRKPDTFYFLNLQQIIVAGIPIDVKRPNATADGAAVEGNIIIDSGTTLTLIDNETLHFVLREVESIVKLPTVTPPGGVFNLCFNVSGQSAADVEFPEIAFRFAGNASIVLPKDNLFAAVDEKTVCSVIVYRGHMGVNIFGNLAQQNFHIGYDLAAMKLTFAPANCTDL